MHHRHSFDIPLPKSVQRLYNVFKAAGFSFYAVGGYVRDFLIHQFHNVPFKSKDVDVVTDAIPLEVADVLRKEGIRCFEKGESFGVMVAHMDGEDFEIATMRSDGADGDGRHPDKVTYTSDLEADHYRRDLTINGLFYDMGSKEVLDYSCGINDVRLKKIRTIGDPWRRLGEDRLRIFRIVRFFNRFNDIVLNGNDDEHLCSQTYSALDFYRRLNQPCVHHLGERILQPISKERIQQEFIAGVKQSVNTQTFLLNLYQLGLMDEVLPGLSHSKKWVSWIGNCKNPAVILAILFDSMSSKVVKEKLLEAKWPSEVFDLVSFLVEVNKSCLEGDPAKMVKLALKMRDRFGYRDHLKEFSDIGPHCSKHKLHLVSYELPEFKGEDVQKKYGIEPGPEMGKKILELQIQHYTKGYHAH